MTFAGLNYLAIVVAGVAGWLVGAAWYGVLGRYWIAAQGKTIEVCNAEQAALKGTVHCVAAVRAVVCRRRGHGLDAGRRAWPSGAGIR